MRRMETLLSTLLVAISALLGRSHCCDDARDNGTEFSVTSWSCINYTASFSWSLSIPLADTTLKLTCGVNDTTKHHSRTSGSVSLALPLTGVAECQISGCYTNRDTFAEYLIPTFTFPCPPPPPPPPTPTMSKIAVSTSPIHPSSSPSQRMLEEPTLTTPGASSSPRSRERGPGELEVVIIAIPVSSIIGIVVLLCLVLFCVFEGNRRLCRGSGKLLVSVDMHQGDKFDPEFSLTLRDYHQRSDSTGTILESPMWSSTTVLDPRTVTPVSASLAEGMDDNTSTTSSQNVFPSLCSEQLLTDTAEHTAEAGDSVHVASTREEIAENGKVSGNEIITVAGITGLDSTDNTSSIGGASYYTSGTSSYLCESDFTSSSSGVPSSSYYGDMYLASEQASMQLPILEEETELELLRHTTEGVCCPTEKDANSNTPTSEALGPRTSDNLASGEVRVQVGSKAEPWGDQSVAPQSTMGNEFLGQCGEDNEVAVSFMERFTHANKPSLQSADSSVVTSGLSTSSYLQWSTNEH